MKRVTCVGCGAALRNPGSTNAGYCVRCEPFIMAAAVQMLDALDAVHTAGAIALGQLSGELLGVSEFAAALNLVKAAREKARPR